MSTYETYFLPKRFKYFNLFASAPVFKGADHPLHGAKSFYWPQSCNVRI